MPLSALLRDRSALYEGIDRLCDDLTLAEWRVANTEYELSEVQESVRGINGGLPELESEQGDSSSTLSRTRWPARCAALPDRSCP